MTHTLLVDYFITAIAFLLIVKIIVITPWAAKRVQIIKHEEALVIVNKSTTEPQQKLVHCKHPLENIKV